MKLKYYLRGMGIGVILTAIVMGFALGGRKTAISDAEIIERAKALGMVDSNSGVLYNSSNEDISDEASEIASGQTLDEKGEEVSEEINQEFASAGESVSDLAETTPSGKTDTAEVLSSERETENKKIEETVVPATPTTTQTGTDTAKTEPASEPATETAPEQEELTAKADEKPDDTNKTEETVAEKPEEPASAVDEPASAEPAPAPTPATTETKTVVIPGGLSSDGVAQVLYNAGVIDNAASFNRFLIDKGKDRVIRSGTKVIPAGATYEEIANIICKG
jgi:hypothetical protein